MTKRLKTSYSKDAAYHFIDKFLHLMWSILSGPNIFSSHYRSPQDHKLLFLTVKGRATANLTSIAVDQRLKKNVHCHCFTWHNQSIDYAYLEVGVGSGEELEGNPLTAVVVGQLHFRHWRLVEGTLSWSDKLVITVQKSTRLNLTFEVNSRTRFNDKLSHDESRFLRETLNCFTVLHNKIHSNKMC